MNFKAHILPAALMAVMLLAMVACASIGRPEGGPKDELPPVYVRSNPAMGALNFKDNKLDIFFDENIKVEDVMNKVVVSPVQKNPPRVVGNGKRLSVELQDTLLPDVTYTIDFSDAVRDLNEGNILDGFAIDFSTGSTRDSLVISGMLFQAENLEPAQGVVVGVYSNLADSAITTLPMDRIAKTNQYGQFVIRNLAPGTYNIFAVNDMNRDYHWDRSEDVAFYDVAISPTVETIEVSDTLRAVNGSDSIMQRQGVRYLPNDVLLTWFNENYRAQYLKEYTRMDSLRVQFQFAAPSDTFPEFTLLNTPYTGERLDRVALLDYAGSRDTLTYWLRDKQLVGSDTLMIAARYLKTDSLNELSWFSDTLKIINKNKPQPKKEKKKKNSEATDSINDSIPQLNFLTFEVLTRGDKDVHTPLVFEASQPLDTILGSGIHLEILEDTIWRPLRAPALKRDSINHLLQYSLHYKWEPGERYRFTADSAAIVGIYNEWNRPIVSEFKVKELEEYSTIAFSLSGYDTDDQVVVQLLNSSDKPVATQVAQGNSVKFEYLTPGTYYARAFIDTNRNGLWDTGSIANKIQPDEVFYYPKKINLKKNWDILQSWNISELPIDQQKPYDIKKNKPKTKDRPVQPTDSEEEEEEDSFYTPGFGSGAGRSNQGGFGGGHGGLRKSGSGRM